MQYILLVIFLFICGHANAEQLLFERQYIGNKAILSYKWKDYKGTTQSLVVSFSKADIARGNNEFKPFDNAKANNASFLSVQKYAKAHSMGRKKIEVSKTNSGFDITFKGISKAQSKIFEKGIDKAQQQGLENYLKQSFYISYGDNNVMPNHRNIAKRYVTAVKPLAKIIKQKTRGQSKREVINYILSFLQSIPYDQLLDWS